MSYVDYLETDYWKEFSSKIRRARNYQCEHCKKRGYEVHHLRYRDEFGSVLYRETSHDVALLCASCHYWAHHKMLTDDELDQLVLSLRA